MPRKRSGWGTLIAGTIAAAPAYIAARWMSRSRRRWLATAAGARNALARLGWNASNAIQVEPLGCGLSNAVVSIVVGDERFVLKAAMPVGTVLAYGARAFGPMPYAEDVSCEARCRRELTALTRLRAAGVAVPHVVAADPEAGLLLLDYIDGEPLIAAAAGTDATAELGRAVAAAHRAGVVLTDCHPGNALWTPDRRAVLLDLEFAQTRDQIGDEFEIRCGFDIAYASAFLQGPARAAFLAETCPSTSRTAFENARRELEIYAPLFARERQRQHRSAA